jgi:glycosyltransferase involved in cell wall biosynthesis
MRPSVDETYVLEVEIIEHGLSTTNRVRRRYSDPVPHLLGTSPYTGQKIEISPALLYSIFSGGYNMSSQLSVRAESSSGVRAKVAFTIKWPNVKGGGSMMVYRYANWLADLGIDVTIYADGNPPDWTSLNVHYIRCIDEASRYESIDEPLVIVYSILELPKLLQYGEHHDRLIFHLCQGDEGFQYSNRSNGTDTSVPIFDFLNSLPVGRIVVSPHLIEYFHQKYHQEVLYIKNGVDLECFTSGSSLEATERKSVLFVGNPNNNNKNAIVLMKSLAILSTLRVNWQIHLVMVCGERLEAPVSIFGTGYTSELHFEMTQDQMRSHYRAADVYVNSSFYEGFGLTSIEAMACGTPVVQCRNHGLQGIIENRVNCIEADSGDPNSIADALDLVLSDAGLREQLRAGGLRTASEFGSLQQRAAHASVFGALTGVDLSARLRDAPTGGLPFSILMPTTGLEDGLEEAVRSLLIQEEQGWEAILVHYGDAATKERLESLISIDSRLRLVASHDVGVDDALATGLALARGVRVGWLPPDWCYLPGRLSAHLMAERSDPGMRVGLMACLADTPDDAVDFDGRRLLAAKEFGVLDLLVNPPLAPAAVMCHRSSLNVVGGFGRGTASVVAATVWVRISLRFRLVRIAGAGATCASALRSGVGSSVDAPLFALADLVRSWTLQDLLPLLDFEQPEQAAHAILAVVQALGEIGDREAVGDALLEVAIAAVKRVNRATRIACRAALLQIGGPVDAARIRHSVASLLDALGHSASHAISMNVGTLSRTRTVIDSQPLAQVAIVAVVRDQWDETLRLILSIEQTRKGIAVELVVIDDGSTDDTVLALPRMRGVVAARFEKPVGVVRARNHGAALSSAPIVVFLGNGVVLSDGWLGPLIDLYHVRPNFAAAQIGLVPAHSDGFALRRETLLLFGGLDESYTDRFAEIDFARRLRDQGLLVEELADSGLQVVSPWGAKLPPSFRDVIRFESRWESDLAISKPVYGIEKLRNQILMTAPAVGEVYRPLFSVLVPCFNQAHYLTAALDSLLAQTYGEWEALVVDDGSEDATSDVAWFYARRDPRVRTFRQRNGGVATALNRGLSEARGDWICWLSADDLFLPEKLAVQAQAILEDPELRFIYTDFRILHHERSIVTTSGSDLALLNPPPEHQVIRFFQQNYFNGITVAVHRRLFDQTLGFNPEYRYGQDYDLWLRTASLTRARFIACETVITRVHDAQGTALFPQAGIFDSARAAGAFLNTHKLEKLFPACDLNDPAQALSATQAVLDIVFHPHSYVHRCGLSPLLLGRLKEGLRALLPPTRQAVMQALQQLADQVGSDARVNAVLLPLLDVTLATERFQPIEPLELMALREREAAASGNMVESEAFLRYFDIISNLRVDGALKRLAI